jgi:dTDP-4-amino-4,6-dideoxygalactose transaminase
MAIPMTDLKIQYASLKEEIDSAIRRVIESGRFIMGPEVEAFEVDLAKYCGTKFAIGVASGTDALILSLLACGIKPGDEVITTPFTFVATAEAITHCGAKPVFVDINPRTFNLDPDLIEPNISSHTKAIIPVHLFGQPADMEPILDIARKYNLQIIEDCAQALSAEYKGQKVGSLGDAGCFSFFPAKNLGAFGDGGAVTTNSLQVAEAIRMLRQHGAKTQYVHAFPGYTSRLDAIQAAILRVKLKYLDNWSQLRREKTLLYTQMLAELEGLEPPYISDYSLTSANYYTVRLGKHGIDRDELRRYLSSRGIESAVYYPISLHLQETHKSLGYMYGAFPQSELAQSQVLSFPMYPEISQEQITEVVRGVKEFQGRKKRPLALGYKQENNRE